MPHFIIYYYYYFFPSNKFTINYKENMDHKNDWQRQQKQQSLPMGKRNGGIHNKLHRSADEIALQLEGGLRHTK